MLKFQLVEAENICIGYGSVDWQISHHSGDFLGLEDGSDEAVVLRMI